MEISRPSSKTSILIKAFSSHLGQTHFCLDEDERTEVDSAGVFEVAQLLQSVMTSIISLSQLFVLVFCCSLFLFRAFPLHSRTFCCCFSPTQQPWELSSREECVIDPDIYRKCWGFCVTPLTALSVLREDEWVIIFTNCASDSHCDSAGPQGGKLCGKLSTSRSDTVRHAAEKHCFMLVKDTVSLIFNRFKGTQFTI